jgi:hypothetical protein
MIHFPHAGSSSFREACSRAPRLVALAIEPSGQGPYVDAVREWIDQTTPSSVDPRPLRLVR